MAERPPHESIDRWNDSSPIDEIERRVCPNCRLYFDVGEDADDVFCSTACKQRHERNEYL